MIRVLFACALAFLVLVVLVTLATFGARLVADGYAVVQVESGCYADVGGGKYLQVYAHEPPKPIEQIISEVKNKMDAPLLAFP